MNVTVLMENTALEGCGLAVEHGLSLYIRYRGRELLLDAGSSGRFADNAQALGVDLSAVETAVLSHGHYDHADGLRRFFQINSRAKVYMRPSAAGGYFAMDPGRPRYIGIHRDILEQSRDRFVSVEGPYALMEGAWLIPDTVRDPAFAGRADNLAYRRGEDDFIPDDYRHEQSLVLEGERGLAVFNSCSHTGIVNIVRGVLEQFPGRKVHAVVGGFHMFSKGETGMNCPPEHVYQVAAALEELGVEAVYTGHCTGGPALALLQERFGPGCRALSTGQVLEL
ncbi:MAG: MBL fold metallo-hydrolase [Lawsonibacter sp.]|nr:MBL fold metallo-hydrolase [Lawsonibacter sp.]